MTNGQAFQYRELVAERIREAHRVASMTSYKRARAARVRRPR